MVARTGGAEDWARLSDDELDARLRQPDPIASWLLKWLRYGVLVLVTLWWCGASLFIVADILLAPLGAVLTAGLGVARWRFGRRFTVPLICACIATSCSALGLSSLMWPPGTQPAPVTTPPPPSPVDGCPTPLTPRIQCA